MRNIAGRCCVVAWWARLGAAVHSSDGEGEFGEDNPSWVPNRSSTLCDLAIFVYQPTEPVMTSEVQVGL